MINKITIVDNLILKLSYVLGVSYFKRYWPVGGSFWNKKHINKNNITDLETVIDGANNYSAVHTQGLVLEFIISIPVVIVAIVYQNQQAKFSLLIIPFIWFIHFYALMVHHHNRVRAKLLLTKLMVDDKEIEKRQQQKNEDNELISICQNNNGFIVHFNYKHLSPTLASYEQAKNYRLYLYQLWSKDYFKISENIFVNDIVSIYNKYKNSL